MAPEPFSSNLVQGGGDPWPPAQLGSPVTPITHAKYLNLGINNAQYPSAHSSVNSLSPVGSGINHSPTHQQVGVNSQPHLQQSPPPHPRPQHLPVRADREGGGVGGLSYQEDEENNGSEGEREGVNMNVRQGERESVNERHGGGREAGGSVKGSGNVREGGAAGSVRGSVRGEGRAESEVGSLPGAAAGGRVPLGR